MIVKRALFEIDMLLSGKSSNAPYRLAQRDYDRAKRAIVAVCAAVESATLEPVPAAMARADENYQRFMSKARALSCRSPRGNKALRAEVKALYRP